MNVTMEPYRLSVHDQFVREVFCSQSYLLSTLKKIHSLLSKTTVPNTLHEQHVDTYFNLFSHTHIHSVTRHYASTPVLPPTRDCIPHRKKLQNMIRIHSVLRFSGKFRFILSVIIPVTYTKSYPGKTAFSLEWTKGFPLYSTRNPNCIERKLHHSYS
jgi:hypothetical protein